MPVKKARAASRRNGSRPKAAAVLRRRIAPVRHAIMVLGMHRSGTSAFTRLLNLLGADLPSNLLPPSETNQTGYWESADLVAIHDSLLASAGSTWTDWRRLNPDWFGSSAVVAFKEKILDVLRRDFANSSLFVIKDPRICRLWPLWRDILDDFGAKPLVVMPLRNPLEIAASLKWRENLIPANIYLLWLRHMLDAEVATRAEQRALATYDSLLKDWQGVAREISARLKITWPRRSATIEVEVERFLTPRLRHHHRTPENLAAKSELVDWVKDAYTSLASMADGADDRTNRSRLDGIRGEFDKASSAFGVALTDGEAELAKRGAEISQVSSDLSTLRNAADELNRERDRLAACLAEEQVAAAKLRTEVGELHTVSSQRQSELQELSAELQSVRASLRDRDGNVEKLSRDLEATRGLLRDSQSENQRVGGELDGAKTAFEWAEAERQRLAGMLAAATSERESIKSDFDRAAAERQSLSDALGAQSQELKLLQSRLDKLQQERDEFSRSAASIPALRIQLGAIQEALADARRDADGRERRIGDLIGQLQSLTKEHDRLRADSLARVDAARRADATSRIRTLEEQLQQESKEKTRLAGELERRNEDVRRIEKNTTDRIAALESLRSAALAESETRAQARIRTLQGKLVDAEAAAAKYAARRRNSASWASRFSPARRRLLRQLAASGLFDADWYLREYPDVAASGLSPVEHYLEEGYLRGYRPNPLFDTRWYLDRYEDVRRAGVNPLVHYLRDGCREGRDPGPDFHTDFYLTANPDVRSSGMNPLSHYLRYGQKEGRPPIRAPRSGGDAEVR
jgi:hypothetical protein